MFCIEQNLWVCWVGLSLAKLYWFLERLQKWAPFVSQGTRFRVFGLGSRAKLLGFAILTVTLAAPLTTIARSTSKA